MSAEQITPEESAKFRRSVEEAGDAWYCYPQAIRLLDTVDALRAEVQRLTERNVSMEAEIRILTEEARRSDAGRVEVPELTAEDAHHELLRVSRENSYNGAEEEAFYDGYNFARSRARLSPSPQPATGAWIDLPAGSWTQEGDEMESSNDPWRDEPKWVPAPAGLYVRDPAFPAHTRFRRPSPQPSADVVELEILRKIAALWLPPFGVPPTDESRALFARLDALRSSTNHGSKET